MAGERKDESQPAARTAARTRTLPLAGSAASKGLSARPELPVRHDELKPPRGDTAIVPAEVRCGQWEYATSSVANEDLQNWLTLMGAEGWELVNFHQYTTHKFEPMWRVVAKRQKT